MKKLFIIALLLNVVFANAQTDEERLTTTLKEFHQALVTKNTVSINQQTDKVLSYGHSNGWVETKMDLVKNLETGFMNYSSYKEDSLQVVINGDVAHARFVADIAVAMNGKDGNYHLKVLEVWVKKENRWLLFARQAIKPPMASTATSNRNGFYRAYETKEKESLKEAFFKGNNKYYYVDESPAVTSDVFKDVSYKLADSPADMNVLNILLDKNGIEQFKKLTENWLGKYIAFIVNDETLFVAKVASVISTGDLSIFSDKSEKELKDLIVLFNK